MGHVNGVAALNCYSVFLTLKCRLFSEYLGIENILAIVCKTYEGVKALEIYDKEGCINKITGLHGLGASIGRALEGRFTVLCLENLRHESKTPPL